MKYSVMVVEDQKDIREILREYLLKQGYEVYEADSGLNALTLFNETQLHLILLDVMLPGIDGFQVLKQIRSVSNVPVIMLTAKQEEIDKLKGFDLGADDYVVKPFSPKEVMKRIEVLIKRIYHQNANKVIKFEDLELNLDTKKLYKKNIDIPITITEFELLKIFFENQGKVMSRDNLIISAFGLNFEGYDRSIDTYIKRIRQKIETDTKNPRYLHTKYGAGYVFGGN